jgi:serine/threonine protein phosphatase PrpC
VQDKGQLLVAGVGDSRCMLGRVLPNGAVRAVPLSTDHTPEHPGEAARIRANGVSLTGCHVLSCTMGLVCWRPHEHVKAAHPSIL